MSLIYLDMLQEQNNEFKFSPRPLITEIASDTSSYSFWEKRTVEEDKVEPFIWENVWVRKFAPLCMRLEFLRIVLLPWMKNKYTQSQSLYCLSPAFFLLFGELQGFKLCCCYYRRWIEHKRYEASKRLEYCPHRRWCTMMQMLKVNHIYQ